MKDKVFNWKNILTAVKHGSGSIILWSCLAEKSDGAWCTSENRWHHEEVLSTIIYYLLSTEDHQHISQKLGFKGVIQQDKDPKSTFTMV